MSSQPSHWIFTRASVARIVSEVFMRDGVALADLISHDKSQPLSRIRQSVWVRIHACGLGARTIAAAFERDLKTVQEGMRSHQRRNSKGGTSP
jgi:hypothetical protein